jgi:hypothetical protein
MDVKLPDGTVVQGVPDGISKADLVAKLKGNGMAVPDEWTKGVSQPSMIDKAKQYLDDFAQAHASASKNALAGMLRGAGSIGATIAAPIDALARYNNDGKPVQIGGYDIVGQDRRAAMDGGLELAGADKNSIPFQVGKAGMEVAGTAGAGGAVANSLRVIPVVARTSPGLIAAIESGGMSGGGNAITRAAGGAINGAATTALVDPSSAGSGAAVGGALPGVVKVAGMTGNALSSAAQGKAKTLMQSAIKPTIAQLRTGDADIAAQTLLDYGISPTKEGVEQLRVMIDDINGQVSNAIKSSNATVSKNKILQSLDGVRKDFGNQVSPTSDLNAIDTVAGDFANHPSIPTDAIPVQDAQTMKQGTYRVLSKKYGQIGSAETEAQKGLARGLKEEIAAAVPEVGPLNAEESKLITTLGVAERRALMELNKNPVGLTALAHNPAAAAGFMADRSAAFKSLAARMINRAAKQNGTVNQALIGAAQNPLIRAGGLVTSETSP